MPEKVLRVLLRVSGGVMLLAVFAIFLPVDWMAATHRWLGLGQFPASPIVDYLSRSLSMFYALYGGLLIVLSFDLRRYRPILFYVAITGVAGGFVLWGIDLHAGMPTRWTAFEGPPAIVLSCVLIWLIRRIPVDS